MPLPTTVGAIIEEKPSSMVQKNDPREIILLVEENSDMALYIGSLFDQHRYHLLHATSGTKALEMAKVSPQTSSLPTAVFPATMELNCAGNYVPPPCLTTYR